MSQLVRGFAVLNNHYMEFVKKLFSQKAVLLATFLGGPIAGGYLIKKNYDAFAENNKGTQAFVWSILFTIFMVGLLVFTPEAIWEKVPNMLLPMVYTLAIYFIVDNTQGGRIKEHKVAGGPFYSMWKAAGIGGISLVVLALLIGFTAFIASDFSTPHFDTEKYDSGIDTFNKNEEKALLMFNVMDTAQHPEPLMKEVEKSMFLWEENKKIVEDLNRIQNLPPEFIKQNTMLIQYCDLRMQHNTLIFKSVSEDSDEYIPEIITLGNQIDSLLSVLNTLSME